MATKKRTDLKTVILKLLAERTEISVHDVAYAAGLSKSNESHRKSIRRELHSLIENGRLETKGAARARVYVAKPQSTPAQTPPIETEKKGHSFKEITLSPESEILLHYVSQSIPARTPVSYHQDFLRAYEPNKTFYLSQSQRLDLLSIGRIESKLMPAGTYARNILNRLLIDLSWNSSRLEGNTYSLLETKRLIELGETVAGKDASEAQMILNHKGAIEYIVESATEQKITAHAVYSIHALLSENLLGDSRASGRVRQIAVGIGGTVYMPLENPHTLKECFELLIKKLNLIKDPYEQSFFALTHLSYLQAFEDINKRTARLVANIPMIRENLRPLSFTDVEQEAYVKSLLGVYEKNDISLLRDLYLWAYRRSAQRYSAVQQAMGQQNLLKLKYRSIIQDTIRAIVLKKVPGVKVSNKVRALIKAKKLSEEDTSELLKIVEIEIISLHDGNIARFKIRPSEFQEWKKLQQ